MACKKDISVQQSVTTIFAFEVVAYLENPELAIKCVISEKLQSKTFSPPTSDYLGKKGFLT